jgi:hypothetical protein
MISDLATERVPGTPRQLLAERSTVPATEPEVPVGSARAVVMTGATLRCITTAEEVEGMPTPHKRILVTRDPELAEALHRVAAYYPGTAPARLVHDLAVKGAGAVVEERQTADDALEQLVAFSTGRSDLIDWDVLDQIDELAWGE